MSDGDAAEREELLDPDNWSEFRRALHDLADACVDHLERIREHPWRPFDEGARNSVALGDAREGRGLKAVAREMVSQILPYGAGNTHPRFFGWVQGTGNVAALMAEVVAATMNSNCGGRDHGAVYVERDVIRWCADCFGFPEHASGVLVSGTSQATVIALATARLRALGSESRKKGLHGAPRLIMYAADGVHTAIVKAAELTGLGSEALRRVPVAGETGGLDVSRLSEMVEDDRQAGALPFCVVGTAGSVDTGSFDPLEKLADFCESEGLWFHVDGAFGAWARIAEEPWCRLVEGIQRADSLALDFHKWLFVQYDCGLVLIRNEQEHRAAFATRPAYLAVQGAGLGGGDPWFCDYGTDLSRSFRALKVWATLRAYGRRRLGAAVTDNCRLAALMGRLVQQSPELELACPVYANVCCFGVGSAPDGETDLSRLNATIVQRLQLSGAVVFSTTKMGGQTVMRAAITNHRTRIEDVELAVSEIKKLVAEMRASRVSGTQSP